MGGLKKILRTIQRRFLFSSIKQSESTANHQGILSFVCNICGRFSAVPLRAAASREVVTCRCCGSTLRFRSVVAALQERLTGEITPLVSSRPRKDIKGLGMSDSSVYADIFAEKFDYVNSFYHTEPFLDITKPDKKWLNQFDFVTSSDVLEHVAPPVDSAFTNLRALLKPGGCLIVSVPYTLAPETLEHFPNLYQYKITGSGFARVLRNTTANGEVESFSELVFHGGDGATLEMRLFSQQGLIHSLERAGFTEINIHSKNFPEFGIVNFDLFSLTISARSPAA
jgi:SAM-dependent methyltransferase